MPTLQELYTNLCPVGQQLEITECEIITEAPPLHPCNTPLRFPYQIMFSIYILRSPCMFMSLKLLTQHSPVPGLDPLPCSYIAPPPTPLLLLWPMTLPHGKPAKVYLNLTQKFTLFVVLSKQSLPPLLEQRSSPLARQTGPCHWRECIQSQRTEGK